MEHVVMGEYTLPFIVKQAKTLITGIKAIDIT